MTVPMVHIHDQTPTRPALKTDRCDLGILVVIETDTRQLCQQSERSPRQRCTMCTVGSMYSQCTPETCLEQCYEGPVVWYLSSHHNHTLLYYGTHCYYTCDNSVTSKWQFIHSLTCCRWTSIINNFLWINHFDTGEFHFNRFGCWAHGVSMWMCVCNSSTMSV